MYEVCLNRYTLTISLIFSSIKIVLFVQCGCRVFNIEKFTQYEKAVNGKTIHHQKSVYSDFDKIKKLIPFKKKVYLLFFF